MGRASMGFQGLDPETIVRFNLLRNHFQTRSYKLFTQMVEELWEKHKDELAARIHPTKTQKVAERAVLRVFRHLKGDYVKKSERPKE